MIRYSIFHTKSASKDISDISYYIYSYLKNSTAANQFIIFIEKEIDVLAQFPYKHNGIGKFHEEMEIRLKSTKGYNIFYVVDESEKRIYVLRIINRRKNWDWDIDRW